VKEICAVRAHINIQNQEGMTPLLVATLYNQQPIVEYLIGIGADPTLKSYDGRGMLEYAKDTVGGGKL
jgi:ankyrin repeat protein